MRGGDRLSASESRLLCTAKIWAADSTWKCQKLRCKKKQAQMEYQLAQFQTIGIDLSAKK